MTVQQIFAIELADTGTISAWWAVKFIIYLTFQCCHHICKFERIQKRDNKMKIK